MNPSKKQITVKTATPKSGGNPRVTNWEKQLNGKFDKLMESEFGLM